MKAIIDRVFPRRDASSRYRPRASAMSSELTQGDIKTYYLRIISDCLQRMLVPMDSIDISVKRCKSGPDGLTSYAGFVRMVRWDPVLTPVLLQNLPVIDASIRKVVAASVLLECTHFAGLWFQASSRAEGAPTALMGVPVALVRQPREAPSGTA